MGACCGWPLPLGAWWWLAQRRARPELSLRIAKPCLAVRSAATPGLRAIPATTTKRLATGCLTRQARVGTSTTQTPDTTPCRAFSSARGPGHRPGPGLLTSALRHWNSHCKSHCSIPNSYSPKTFKHKQYFSLLLDGRKTKQNGSPFYNSNVLPYLKICLVKITGVNKRLIWKKKLTNF